MTTRAEELPRTFVPLTVAAKLTAAFAFGAHMVEKTRSQLLSEKARDEQKRCRDWLLPYLQTNQPKYLTKDELRAVARRELNVSRSSFDFAWISAIEETGRHDWYEPLRTRLKPSN